MDVLFIFIGLIGVILYFLINPAPVVQQQVNTSEVFLGNKPQQCICSKVLEQREFHITPKKQKICGQHTLCSPKNHCAKSQFGTVCTDRKLYNDGVYSNRYFTNSNVIIPSNLPTMTTMGTNTSITELTALTTEFVPTTISS